MAVQRYHIRGRSANEISASIEEGIRTGRLERGQQLPSVRALADKLGVSPVTVASAFRSLRTRGLISTGGRRGTQVAPRPPLGTHSLPSVPAGARKLFDGNPDRTLLPPLDKALASLPSFSRMYDDLPVLPEFGELARESFAADGVPTDAITVAGGAFDAISRVLDAQLSPGDCVAIEDPGYHRTIDLLAAQNLVAQPLRVDERGPIPSSLTEAIKAGARAIIITPRAQNPMGSALDAKRAQELRRIIAREPELLVIEDDHAGAISGVDYVTLVENRDRWAVVRSFSKFYGPDLRAAAVTGDETTISRVEGRIAVGPGWVSYILQRLIVALWNDPEVQEQLAVAAEHYEQRRRWMTDALKAAGIEATGRSGLNVWVPVLEENRVVSAMGDAGFAIRAGEAFRLDSPPAVRITISTLQEGEAEAVAGELARVMRASRGSLYSA